MGDRGAPKRFRAAAQILRHPLVTNVGVLTASQYGAALVGFATTAIAARLLGPAEYGHAALLVAYPTLIWSLLGTKSIGITIRYLASFRASDRHVEFRSMCKVGYGLDAAAALTSVAAVAATSRWISEAVLDGAGRTWITTAYAASFPVYSMVGTSSAILSSLNRFRLLALLQIVEKLLGFLFVVSAVLAGGGVAGVVIGTALANFSIGAAMTVTAAIVLRREGMGSWWTSPLHGLATLRKEIGAFFGWNYATVAFAGIVSHFPALLLGQARGPEEAGYYRVASSILIAGSYAEVAMNKVTYPLLSARWARGERASLRRTLRNWSMRAGLPVGATLFAGAILLLPVLVPTVLGASYRPMVVGAQLMMVGAAVSVVFFYLGAFYYASGRAATLAGGYAFYAGAIIAGSLVAAARWGFLGVAATVGLATALFNLVMAEALRRSWRGAVAGAEG